MRLFRNPNEILCICFIALVIVGLIGCASDAPSVHKLLEMQQTPEKEGAPKPEGYVIKPLDVIDVKVWKEPELSGERLVRNDGSITLPLVGDFQAAGMTTKQLSEKLKTAYKEYIEYPEVSVALVRTQLPRIYISGEVAKPGEYEIQPGMKIIQAITLAGGMTEWANKSKIILIRKIKDEEMRFMVNYDDIVSGKDPQQNVLLKAGDVIVVQ